MDQLHSPGSLLSKPLFVAIPLPSGIKEIFHSLRPDSSEGNRIRWTPADNLHLTLFYIGRTAISNIPGIKLRLSEMVNDFSPFTLDFERILFKKRPRGNGMIWAQYLKNDFFSIYSLGVNKSFETIMDPGNRFRDPIPHITLARTRQGYSPSGAFPHISIADVMIPVDHFELWESNQSGNGVFYKSMGHFSFRNVKKSNFN